MIAFISRIFLPLLTFSLLVFACQSEPEPAKDSSYFKIIPKPEKIEPQEGNFTFKPNQMAQAVNWSDQELQELQQMGAELSPIKMTVAASESSDIRIIKDQTIASEAYNLSINSDSLEIKASSLAGVFYALQSLQQIIPPSYANTNSVALPGVVITDAPKFKYRGMHLDVSRHFFSPDEIKNYIDVLAMLKMNRFHWHLTDDQGWRIEIKKYSRLQTHAAYREQTLIGHYNDTPQQFDGTKYGGYYTQEEVKDIVAYAKQRQITVIPEIEMPGHAQAAISAYPHLGCTGDAVKVAQKWGVFEDIYCPKPETFAFLKDVLDEVITLFPSEYIHIGGDEAPKTKWKACGHCNQLIAKEGLANEHELQSYFIKEIEGYLNSKGRSIIGWDEILEGGLAPNATVMSWRGTSGAVEAAKEGHDVILTPTSHAYFDYYQDTSPEEPLAIGGYLPLKKVYGFSPYPTELPQEYRKYVLGAQGNIWTEYMQDFKQMQYMAYPRTMAMSEVVWSGPTKNLDADYANFLDRLELGMFPRLDQMGITYANHLNNLEGKVVKKNDSLFYKLIAPLENKKIGYAINKSPQLDYTGLIPITEPSTIYANVLKDYEPLGRTFKVVVNPHKGTRATIAINKTPHPSYNAGGIDALNDGVMGSNSRYGDDQWLGFWGEDLLIGANFEAPTKISSIALRFYHAPGQWIYAPQLIAFRLHLTDGSVVADKLLVNPDGTLAQISYDKDNLECTKVEIQIPNYGIIPDGKQGAGNKAWTFIDEITID